MIAYSSENPPGIMFPTFELMRLFKVIQGYSLSQENEEKKFSSTKSRCPD